MYCEKTYSCSTLVYLGLRKRDSFVSPGSAGDSETCHCHLVFKEKKCNPFMVPPHSFSPFSFPIMEGLKAFLRMKMLKATRPQHRPWNPASITNFPSPCCSTLAKTQELFTPVMYLQESLPLFF